MRYGISPAERNELAKHYQTQGRVAAFRKSSTTVNLTADERSEQHELNRFQKQKLYGKMRTRKKPETW